jgi:hypothetical protein
MYCSYWKIDDDNDKNDDDENNNKFIVYITQVWSGILLYTIYLYSLFY